MPNEAFWTYRLERMRWLVAIGVLTATIMGVIVTAAFVSSFAWPQTGLGDPNATINLGRVTDFKVDEPVFFSDGRFWLVRQPDDSFVAFSARDPHSTCTVPWRPDFVFEDTRDGVKKAGWFRDPCHGSTYDLNGAKVFGPSPRNLDTYPVEVLGQQVIVHAGDRHLIHGDAIPSFQPYGPPYGPMGGG